MADDFEQKKIRAYTNRRSIMDIGMGVIIAGLGIFFIFSDRFGIKVDFEPKFFLYIFGGLCILYGGFRIYRGTKKNYFR